jgi:hypothetical protein
MSDKTLEELNEEYESIKKEIEDLLHQRWTARNEINNISIAANAHKTNAYDYPDRTLEEVCLLRYQGRKAFERTEFLTRQVEVVIPGEISILRDMLEEIATEAEEHYVLLNKLQ